MKKTTLLAVTVALAVAAPPVLAQTRLSIATGGTGGVYYPLGGGLANVLTKSLQGVEATAEVTSASVDNVKLVGSGRADIPLVLVGTAGGRQNARDDVQ